LQVAVLPTLQVGGATVKNVVVLMLEDANLKVGTGKHAYQINAISRKNFAFSGRVEDWRFAGLSRRTNMSISPATLALVTPCSWLYAEEAYVPSHGPSV